MIEELLADIEKRFEEKIHPRGAWYCRGVILYIYKEVVQQALAAAAEGQCKEPEPQKRTESILHTAIDPNTGERWYTANPGRSRPELDWKPLL